MRKHILTVACLGLGVLAWAQAERNSAAKMIAAAHRFLDGLRADQRLLATIPFHDEERQNWHYVPRPRKGVPLRQLTREQRELGDTLLRTGLSEEGFEKTKNIRLLDQVLFDESRNPIRDQEAYFFSILGEPTAKDWGWRVEGHHLSLNFTVHDGQVASSTLFSSAPILPKSAGARALACAFWPQRKKWAVGCCVLCRGRSERKR